jgi:hypothetical protein
MAGGAPAWVDVVLGGLGTSVVTTAASFGRDTFRARRQRTAELAQKAADDTKHHADELADLRERVANLEGRNEAKEAS